MKKLTLDSEDQAQLQAICAKYLAKGEKIISIEYSGAGDSMDYEQVEVGSVTQEEEQFLTEVVLEAAFEAGGHDGFWNNEGGQGTLTIDLTTGSISLHHEDNIIEVDVTDTSFTL